LVSRIGVSLLGVNVADRSAPGQRLTAIAGPQQILDDTPMNVARTRVRERARRCRRMLLGAAT
jgi:hypothetical protein